MNRFVMILLGIMILTLFGCAYSQEFDTEQRFPERCDLMPLGVGLECIESANANSQTNEIVIAFRNQYPYEIEQFALESSEICTGATFREDSIPPSEDGVMTLIGCDIQEGQRYFEEFTITYVSKESGQMHSVSGKVSGGVK